jgi:starch phosphorylase
MAHLACVGSYAINGVAELHSRLLKGNGAARRRPVAREFHNNSNDPTPLHDAQQPGPC